jgi:methanogenic corrinoid protein MtbC1
MINMEELSLSVQAGQARETAKLIRRALEEHCPVKRILEEGLLQGISAVEERYGAGLPPAPEFVLAKRAFSAGLNSVRENSLPEEEDSEGAVIIGTVKNDLRDIEKNLGVLMMELQGLRVIDLGVSVSAERFIETARTQDAQLIACSAASLAAMPYLKGIVQGAEAAGLRDRVKILITGKPVTEQYRAHIGADYYALDMISAAEIAAGHCRRIFLPAA